MHKSDLAARNAKIINIRHVSNLRIILNYIENHRGKCHMQIIKLKTIQKQYYFIIEAAMLKYYAKQCGHIL